MNRENRIFSAVNRDFPCFLSVNRDQVPPITPSLKMDALKAFKYKMFLKRKKNDEQLEKEILNQ